MQNEVRGSSNADYGEHFGLDLRTLEVGGRHYCGLYPAEAAKESVESRGSGGSIESGKSIGRRCVCGQEAYMVNPDGKTFWVCKGCESVNWECECESQQSSGSEKSIESRGSKGLTTCKTK